MKINGYAVQHDGDSVPPPGAEVMGHVEFPQGSKFRHITALPPRGDIVAFFEVPDVQVPKDRMDIVVLKSMSSIPEGYEYLGYVPVMPILFIYRRKSKTIVSGLRRN